MVSGVTIGVSSSRAANLRAVIAGSPRRLLFTMNSCCWQDLLCKRGDNSTDPALAGVSLKDHKRALSGVLSGGGSDSC